MEAYKVKDFEPLYHIHYLYAKCLNYMTGTHK